MRHKIGLYLRVSTDEQAARHEGSLDNQKHRLMSFVDIKNVQDPAWGKVVETYVDDGISAKDTKRPEFQRMMRDIRKGKINLILVTDLARLSRNILDFCILLEDLKKASAKFLSIKEQFDTTTAAGEMMVFNMINLAQFERKQTSERVSMNFHARALRGLRNGGHVILGFDIDKSNKATFKVNEEEAVRVRDVFRIFLEEGTCAKAADRLNREHITPRARPERNFSLRNEGKWTRNAVLLVLRNPAYAGLRDINRKSKNKDPETLRLFERYQVVKASWPAIVEQEVWTAAQRNLDLALEQERTRLANKETRVFLLSGILRCKSCGGPLMGSAAHGKVKVHRYYRHRKLKGQEITCPIDWIRADDVEDAIVKHLNETLHREGYMDGIEARYEVILGQSHRDHLTEKTALRGRLSNIEMETKKVIELQLSMNDATVDYVFRDKIKTLAEQKKHSQGRLNEIELTIEDQTTVEEAVSRIQKNTDEFQRGWKKATPHIQRRLIRSVFRNIVASYNGLELHYRVDEKSSETGCEMKSNRLLDPASAVEEDRSIENYKRIKRTPNRKVGGSLIDRIGCGERI